MPQPIAYNSGNPISGSIEKSTLSFTVEGAPRDERDYSSSYAGVDWYSTIPPQDGKYVIISASNPPMIWVTADETNAELLTTINGLPDRYNQTLFTDTGSALDYLAQNAYFVSRKTPEQIDADSIVLNMDAGLESSYPRTGTTWYDLSGVGNNGTLVNGTTFDSNGAIEFDGVDDFGNFSSAINFDDGSPFTAQCLISIPYFTGQNLNRVHWISGVGGNSMMIFYSTSFLMWNEAGGVNNLSINYNFPTNKIFQATITRDSNNVVSLYVNGTYINQGSRSGQFRWVTFARLGSITAYCSRFSLYNMMVYGKSLSSTEVLQNYYGGPIVTDGLVFAVDASNLVSYESGSTTTYSLTGSLSGSLVNGVGYSSNNGGTWVFDGVDDKLTFGSPNITSSCTVNQWIQPLSGSATTMRTIEYVAVNSATAVLYSQLIKVSNTWYHQTLVSGYQAGYAEEMNMYFQSNVTSFVQNNTPYNFTFTWERTPGVNSTLKTYLNGVFREQQVNTNNYWANTASLATATYNIASSYKGNIGTTSFYNRALTASEVLQNYNAQKARFI